MNKRSTTAVFAAMGLMFLCIGWSMATDEKDCPFAKQEAGQTAGENKGAVRHAKPARRPLLAWLLRKSFGRDMLSGGYRSLALPIKEYQLLNLRPGDFVDVMATFDASMKDNRKEKVTATLLQHVKVLGVVKTGDLEGRGVLHLLLNPNEAQYAALARYQGELDIALRAEGDSEMHPMEMASFRKLFTK
ncbi:MAG: RcpC/CpaB family pilus assembly protein [Elusimicrobiota bacterium]|jgi:Flp pilus assembly protein CpaB